MAADGSEIDSILQILGFAGSDPAEAGASDGTAPLHVEHRGEDAWIEVPNAMGQPLLLRRREARLVLHLLRHVRAWAAGKRQVGAETDVRWNSTVSRGVPVLEISVRTWKPVRIAQEQAEAILLHESRIRHFAHGE